MGGGDPRHGVAVVPQGDQDSPSFFWDGVAPLGGGLRTFLCKKGYYPPTPHQRLRRLDRSPYGGAGPPSRGEYPPAALAAQSPEDCSGRTEKG